MKTLFTLGCALFVIGAAQAGTQVGASIGINQPGVYGRIDIGSYPQPAIVYPQPVVIMPSPVAVYQRPVYLYVPAEHQMNWGRYCQRYGACGQPVYFVREDWVQTRYTDEHRYRREHGRGDDHGNGTSREHGHQGSSKHDRD
jgi:hypothetical protein